MIYQGRNKKAGIDDIHNSAIWNERQLLNDQNELFLFLVPIKTR